SRASAFARARHHAGGHCGGVAACDAAESRGRLVEAHLTSQGDEHRSHTLTRRRPMPQKAWSDKRERQYEHIKDSYEDRGVGVDEAEERAARTVNKERA